jgi:hypothetical protein
MNLMALEENRWFPRAYNRTNCFNFDLNEFRRQKFGGHVEMLKQGRAALGPWNEPDFRRSSTNECAKSVRPKPTSRKIFRRLIWEGEHGLGNCVKLEEFCEELNTGSALEKLVLLYSEDIEKEHAC